MIRAFLRIRPVAEFLVVAICTVTFALAVVGILGTLLQQNSAGTRDYVEYWTSGHLLISGGNPYDEIAIHRMELSVGFPPGIPTLIMANPPSTLLLMLPLGFMSARAGEFLWEMLLVGALIATVRIIWAIHGSPKNLLHWIVYAFAPVLSCLMAGQVSLFVLLGLALFLRLYSSRPFWAGCALWLCMLKPHLFLPFGSVLLLWIVLNRRYRILAGVMCTLAISSSVATLLDPQIWMQYAHSMKVLRVDRAVSPCLSILLRQHVPPHTLWLQCVPALLGSLWAVLYFWKRQPEWDWMRHGSLLMIVSILIAPYTWFMDQAVLLPSLLHGLYCTRSRALIAGLAFMSAMIEIAAIRNIALLYSPFYIWTVPGWLIWYVLATKVNRESLLPKPTAEPPLTFPVSITE